MKQSSFKSLSLDYCLLIPQSVGNFYSSWIRKLKTVSFYKDEYYSKGFIYNDLRKSIHTFSLSVSKAEVASSSSKILGSRTMARAIAMRCFSPLESWDPWDPTLVSYFWKKHDNFENQKQPLLLCYMEPTLMIHLWI